MGSRGWPGTLSNSLISTLTLLSPRGDLWRTDEAFWWLMRLISPGRRELFSPLVVFVIGGAGVTEMCSDSCGGRRFGADKWVNFNTSVNRRFRFISESSSG